MVLMKVSALATTKGTEFSNQHKHCGGGGELSKYKPYTEMGKNV